MTTETVTAFNQLALDEALLKALDDVGYETPSPIQAQTIPLLLEGKDVLGQAQTGTGKTAAFALPLLSNLDITQKDPQILVLAPTRELAIQVAEAFQKYATHIKGFHVLPVYGGQDYRTQIRALERGVHVVVGTPGRVMDHMRRGTLRLGQISALVLDEADEMLRMGFIDDVQWILEQTPKNRQTALFSATLPAQIRRIASEYLNDPVQITIKVKTTTADTIRQRYWIVNGSHKLDALTRILESEPFEGMLVFVRTRTATVDLAEKLEARGYAAAPLSGDIQQQQRERTVNQLKSGKLDILVATDVAARGLDVDRISHVINFDIPNDTEAYVHRIGRTGRAGRAGDAILFVTPREKRLLGAIERATRNKIELMDAPSTKQINERRIERFNQRITDILAGGGLSLYTNLVEGYQKEHDVPAQDIAAALAKLAQGDTPLLMQKQPQRTPPSEHRPRDDRHGDKKGFRHDRPRPSRGSEPLEKDKERYRIEVGHDHGVKPGNIVGAIANEAGIDAQFIGRIDIQNDYSIIDLPEGMPKEIFKQLKKVWVSGQQLRISRLDEKPRSKSDYPKDRKKPGQDKGQRRTFKKVAPKK